MDGTEALMFTILDRHIGRSMLIGTALVFCVFAALFVFIVLVDTLPDYGKGRFDLYEMTRYILLTQPRKLYEIFPVTVLIGTLLGLSTLALNSELVAMRAAGVSKARIIVSTMKTGLFLMVAAVLVGEYVVPVAETQAETGRAQALEIGFQQGETGLWLRDGSSFVNIGEVLPDLSLLRVSVYDISPDYQLREHTYAARAVYADEHWQLEHVQRSQITPDAVESRPAKVTSWDAAITPDDVAVFTTSPQALSITQLHAYIRHLRANNQDVAQYMLAFWQKGLMPLATAVMVLLAMPFVFRPARSGGMAQRIFVGIALGLLFVVVNRSFGFLGLIYGVPPIVAATVPLVVFLGIAVAFMRRAE
jgi:lipopolysaccharide export system permease protein